MKNLQSTEDILFQTDYKILSSLNDIDNERYYQTIRGSLYINPNDDEEDNLICIGKLQGVKLLFEAAQNNDIHVSEVFDVTSDMYDFLNPLYDYNKNQWIKSLQNILDESFGADFLILERIEILPEYQNLSIGKKWIKDFYLNFISGSGVILLKAFPLQYESENTLGKDQEWWKKMNYKRKDSETEEFAQEKLLKYYQSIGFRPLTKSNKNILYICPTKRNEKLEKIHFT